LTPPQPLEHNVNRSHYIRILDGSGTLYVRQQGNLTDTSEVVHFGGIEQFGGTNTYYLLLNPFRNFNRNPVVLAESVLSLD
jgi:hypothetical protein